MNKDVIYIDVEDDITAIIGKIKASSEKIVALVPPKRVGVLQSAVNLRLLERMAKNANKRMVLITNNPALIGLSAAAGIPVAKNLQSKPEIAQIPALSIDDEEDIIDGSQLPVGELEKTADSSESLDDRSVDKAINSIAVDDKSVSVAALGATAMKKISRSKSGTKVPNFNSFRKKLFIGIAAGVLLLTFLIWAIWFAPSAKVIITARTTPASVNTTATLAGNAATDVSKGLIQSVQQQTKKDASIDFTPTGKKDIGEKASGTMKVTRTSVSNTPLSVPAGTSFTSGDFTFVSTEAATLEGTQVGTNGFIQDSETVAVTAAESGESYNLSARSYNSDVNGISASGSQMAGGTTKIVTVVTADDVQKANASLSEQPSDEIKKQLIKQFTNGEVVIDESFTIVRSDPTPAPAVGAEAGSVAKLTSSATYTITAIAKSDLEIYLKANLEKQLVGTNDQRVYDNGVDKVKLTDYVRDGDAYVVKIISTGRIGPQIDESAIKDEVKGKIYGEVQSTLEQIDGVSSVDVQFPYFWVRTVPNDTDKITVEFKLENE